MPWTSRPSRKPAARLRRWRYDHSHDLRALWIGAAVVMTALMAIVGVRALI